MKVKKITTLSMSLSLMLIIGWIFEVLVPIGFLGSFVKPSPAEGLILFILIIYGFKSAIGALSTYILILFTFKGVSPLFIEELALTISSLLMVTVFWVSKNIFKNSENISYIIMIIIVSVLMLFLNAFFITPTFLNLSEGGYAIYSTVFKGKSFWDILKMVSIPPIGIAHGNIIKYIFVALISKAALKTFKTLDTNKG